MTAEAELTPISSGEVGDFVMMKADLDTIPSTYDPKIAKLNPEQLKKPFNDAARAISAMGTLMAYAGASSEEAMKAAACFQLISAGVEISGGFQALFEALTALKTAEGTAQLSKYTVAAPIVAAAAMAGMISLIMIMESQEFNFSGDYSGSSGSRKLQSQIAKEGITNG